jgi:hypothetical protein
VILARLKERPLRYGELRQLIPALSDKVLTQRLRDPEARGLITRARAADARETAYWLTLMGETLRPMRMPFTPAKSDNQLTLALASLRGRAAPLLASHRGVRGQGRVSRPTGEQVAQHPNPYLGDSSPRRAARLLPLLHLKRASFICPYTSEPR